MAPEGEDIDQKYGRERGEVRRIAVGGNAYLDVVKKEFSWLKRLSLIEGWECFAIREYPFQRVEPSDPRGRARPP